jgi:hypothetical protein
VVSGDSADEGFMVACGTCDANPGDFCHDNITGEVMDKPHGSRTWDAMVGGYSILFALEPRRSR